MSAVPATRPIADERRESGARRTRRIVCVHRRDLVAAADADGPRGRLPGAGVAAPPGSPRLERLANGESAAECGSADGRARSRRPALPARRLPRTPATAPDHRDDRTAAPGAQRTGDVAAALHALPLRQDRGALSAVRAHARARQSRDGAGAQCGWTGGPVLHPPVRSDDGQRRRARPGPRAFSLRRVPVRLGHRRTRPGAPSALGTSPVGRAGRRGRASRRHVPDAVRGDSGPGSGVGRRTSGRRGAHVLRRRHRRAAPGHRSSHHLAASPFPCWHSPSGRR